MRVYALVLLIYPLTCATFRAQEVTARTDVQEEAKPTKVSKGEQLGLNQLRAITEEIKKCPQTQITEKDGSGWITYPPKNVIWNTKQNYSARSETMGYIQLVKTETYVPKPLEACRKRDRGCAVRNENTSALNAIVEQTSFPDEYRYEFDIDQKGLEPVQAFYKHQMDTNNQWLAGSFGDDCIGKSISVILSDQGKN